jgi:zinc finger MIZ domain-containing protein
LSQNRSYAANGFDGRRLDVLRDAVRKQDWDYLTIHQYYCLLDIDRATLPLKLTNDPNLPAAYSLVKEVLDTNGNLSPATQTFFTKFPLPLAQMATNWPRAYEQQQHMFFRFMSLAGNFPGLKNACGQRKYPPLARELAEGLGK